MLNSAYSVSGNQVSFTIAGDSLLDGYYTLEVVPEPGTLLLLAAGGILLWRRARK